MELWIFVNSRLCIRLYPCGSVVRQMFVLGNSGSTVRLPSVGNIIFFFLHSSSVDRHITVGLIYLILSVFGARRTPQAVPITPRLLYCTGVASRHDKNPSLHDNLRPCHGVVVQGLCHADGSSTRRCHVNVNGDGINHGKNAWLGSSSRRTHSYR